MNTPKLPTTLVIVYVFLGTVITATPRLVRQVRQLPPTCKSPVYCQGPLLHDAQFAYLYNDSKSFVDLKLKSSEDEVAAKYEQLRSKYGGRSPPAEVVKQFVDDNFESGEELNVWVPPDFTPRPSLVDRVSDPLFKEFVVDLNNITLTLSRKVKTDVRDNPDRYSFLYVPNGFIIPSQRFTELYYWDTYFILRGLLLCDMKDTARGVIENLLYLLRNYNIIPNGSRKYYLERSQPPLVIPMVEEYYRYTKDLRFVRRIIGLLEKEFNFWMENRSVIVKKNNEYYKLFRYNAPSKGPRPESYREDYSTAAPLPTESQKTKLYINIKSAAESGLDFSSRWFIKDGTNNGDLIDIDTTNIIPVDLNAFLEYNARLLSAMFTALGDREKAKYYKYQSYQLLKAIDAILWREDRGIWLDYDLKNLKSRDYFYLTNIVPLWTGSYQQSKPKLSKKVLKYLAQNNVDQYIGGVPTSLYNTTQQWDFPNGWPPLEAFLVEGLKRLETRAAYKKSLEYATKWLRSNYEGFKKFGKMFEKYDVEKKGETGTGGEYSAQTGFGWTNGVCLKFLDLYGTVVTAEGRVRP